MKEQPVALAHKTIVFPHLSIDLSKIKDLSNINWSLAGLMIYHEATAELEVGIQAKTKDENGALLEVRGFFETKDFDPSWEEDVTAVRQISFGFLFPYLRTAVSQVFSLAGVPVSPLPIVYVSAAFGNVPLTIQKNG